MTVRLFASAVAVAAAVAAFGCSTAPARRPNAIASSRLRLDPQLAEGQRIFMQDCNQCHVGGAAGLGPSLNDRALPEFVIRFQVRHGLGSMPKFSGRTISDPELGDLIHYLKILRDHPNGFAG